MNSAAYIPVSVIASFNTSGQFIPLWFRYEDCVYDVSAKLQKEEYPFKYFDCRIEKCSDEDNAKYTIGKELTLIFHEKDFVWGISKNKY